MSPAKATVPKKIDLADPQYYFNRELSWLEFNNRVLCEGMDERNPLLERLKFLAIFSNNLDEFFMVRVAGLQQQVSAGVTKLTFDGRSPSQQLTDIHNRLAELVHKQDQHFQHTLRPLLAQAGIHLLDYFNLSPEQRNYLDEFYQEHIFPVLTPLAVDPSHPFPHISNLSLNLAVVVKDHDGEQERFARIKVPKVLSRFVSLPDDLIHLHTQEKSLWVGVPIEQVIAHNLGSLFPGMDIQECYAFRITRNASLSVEEDEADDLLLAIEQELHKRRLGGSTVRLEIHESMPEDVRAMLTKELEVEETDVYEVEGLIGLDSLFYFLGLPFKDLKDKPWNAVVPTWIDSNNKNRAAEKLITTDFFDILRQGDRLVHHPYQSFSATVQEFITQASQDPNVLAIKMTLYRTSGDSPIINALIDAAQNGKQVAALVELKARFDEENNINWARTLEQKGVHVVYGLVGLKTHTKVVLVVRQEKNKIRRYVHIGTGNYNPKTARLYTDLGLFSCREDLGADLTDLFNYLTGYSHQSSFRKLLVAPITLRQRMLEMIEREIEHCNQGGSGRIVAKMNSLVDQPVMQSLYRASQAGVKIDLIVRGICCLRPGLEGLSENIRVISVVGRFLEHSRIFYFYNGGQEEIYIGSADWMTRNLSRRVEAVTPIEDPKLLGELNEILGVMLSDNRLAWELQPDGRYVQRQPTANGKAQNTHNILMKMALEDAHLE